MTDHSDLIARLEAASEGSRELDALIEVAARWDDAARAGLAPNMRAKWRAARSGHVSDGYTTYDSAPVTTSLDAIVALIERKLPGWSWGVSGALSPICTGLLYEPAPTATGYRVKVRETGSTPTLALCIALLRAQEPGHGG